MKVREVMAEFLEKDPDDEVELEVKVNLYVNDKTMHKVERSVPVTGVANGNTPVILRADLTINVDSKLEVY